MRKTLLQTILAAFCAILCTHLCVGGGGMMIGARTAAWAKSGGWVNPYQTADNALVLMWDSEWNAGGGIHDPNALVWKDVVKGVELTVENGTWRDNELQLNGGRAHNSSIPELVEIIDSQSFSIVYGGVFDVREGVIYGNETTGFKIGGYSGSSWVSSSTSTQGSTFWSKNNATSATVLSPYPMRYESRFGWDDSMAYHPSQSTSPSLASSQQAGIGTRRCFDQFVAKDWECKTYVDSNFFNAAMINQEAIYKNYGFTIGSYANRSYMTFFAFRAYNRDLTLDEMTKFQMLDKARFNLP